jgi:hypothetical protein
MNLPPFDDWLKQQIGPDAPDCANLVNDQDCLDQELPSFRWCLSCRQYARLVTQYNELERKHEKHT